MVLLLVVLVWVYGWCRWCIGWLVLRVWWVVEGLVWDTLVGWERLGILIVVWLGIRCGVLGVVVC